ncbi:hypothetical protein [Nocardia yunnanensis]|uniref:hypothetical protein n=1 Tax=Nocardia yunnanensis TaxID=2382165 RepID=UPI0013C45903|nr:hypothetical protein [Nocardia yunnanensis]
MTTALLTRHVLKHVGRTSQHSPVLVAVLAAMVAAALFGTVWLLTAGHREPVPASVVSPTPVSCAPFSCTGGDPR